MKIQKSFKNNKNIFYIIPTPIGNLEDITLRTLNILKNDIDILLCEDTRNSKKLLNKYEIGVKLKSYHEFSQNKTVDNYITEMEKGIRYGLISDAGMPGISDPGYEIIKKALERDINVVVLPGATAFLVALVRSNYPNEKFEYHGFLNSNQNKKKKEIEIILEKTNTVVAYESPHKLLQMLKIIHSIDPQKEIMLARELTKINEEFLKASVIELLNYYENNAIKGEFVVVFSPKKEMEMSETIEEQYDRLIKEGLTKKEAIKKIASSRKIVKNQIYKMFVEKDYE